MSLFSALMIITVSVLGSIEISIQDEQKREQLYQTYLSQKDISDYKSAIFLFPGREEGYQQFLESIMEDGQVDRQEHQNLCRFSSIRKVIFRKTGELIIVSQGNYLSSITFLCGKWRRTICRKLD